MADKDEDRSKLFSCASDVLQRITAIETTLASHIKREERTQLETKWLSRFILVTLVGIIVQQWAPWT